MTFSEYLDLVIEELEKYFRITEVYKKYDHDYIGLTFIDGYYHVFDMKPLREYYETSDKDYKLHAFILKGAIEHDYLEQIKK